MWTLLTTYSIQQKILSSCPNFYKTVERKRGWYNTLTMAYIWSENILTYESIMWAQKTLLHFKEIAVSSISMAEDINDMIHVIVDYRVGIWSFNVNKCNVAGTLLPHGAVEVSFQLAQRTEWSLCWTRYSRYHCKNMHHLRKLWKYIK